MNKEEAIQRSTTTFNSAADYFDAPALSFWNRFGQRTIDRLDPATQARVKSTNLEFLRTNQIQALNSDVLYAIVQK